LDASTIFTTTSGLSSTRKFLATTSSMA